MFIKLASWNIGWFGNLLQGRKRDLIATQITSAAGKALQKKQRRQIAREIELIDADVQRVNARFSRVENVRRFVILRKQLDHDDGEVTATMKVRRANIQAKYGAEIEGMYRGG